MWAEAVNTAIYLLNRTPTTQAPNSTPYCLWFGKKPSLGHVRTFGCEAYVFVPNQKRTKLEPKSKKLILVGYENNSENYRLFDLSTKKITVSRNVIFYENPKNSESMGQEQLIPFTLEEEQRKQYGESKEERNAVEVDQRPPELEKEEDRDGQLVERPNTATGGESPRDLEKEEEIPELRPRRQINTPKRFNEYELYELNFVETDVPDTYEEAMKCGDWKEWQKAIDGELDALRKNNTWEVTSLPDGKKAINSKWVFKVKRHPNGCIQKYKARLCAKDCSQKPGVDYSDIFSPTTRFDSIRVLLASAAKNEYRIMQFDIKTAFLYGELAEEIFMNLPSGVEIKNNMVCKLKKSLYGLKQAPRCWNHKFNMFLTNFGFKSSEADSCVYKGIFNNKMVLLVIYVDDGLIFCVDMNIIKMILSEMEKFFEIVIEEKPSYFVGMEIQQKDDGSIFIHQGNYIREIIKRFRLDDATPNSVPSDPNTVLSSESDSSLVGQVPYREAVGSLLFAATVTRPDIMHSVSVASRYLNNHGQSHWNAVKRIIKYLIGTKDIGIYYKNDVNSGELIGYSDSDFAADLNTRRSTTGYIFKFCNGPVTWNSQRQHSVSLSTTEAEYVAASHAAKESVWLKQLLSDIGEYFDTPIKLCIDNQSAIRLIRNPEFHKRTKHIDIRYHFVREKYKNGQIDLKNVPSEEQLADFLTKGLPRAKFEKQKFDIGLRQNEK